MAPPSALTFLADASRDTSLSVEPDRWIKAFSDALQIQLRAYGRILLPVLGRGQRRHLPERRYRIGGKLLTAPRHTVWFFDTQTEADWLDIAVSYPLENIDDWVILIHRDQVPEKVAQTLRPPLVPGLRQSLSSRPWTIVDVCETREGNLEVTDFQKIIANHPWLRLDHRTDTGLCTIETWKDQKRITELRLELDVDLQADISADFPVSEHPLLIDPAWKAPTEDRLLIAVADVLDDIYSTLRRLVHHRYELNVDRLGPLFFWRDWPDELFEFNEREDPQFLDIAHQMAAILEQPVELVSQCLTQWLTRCTSVSRCTMPFIGELSTTMLPDLHLTSVDESHEPITIPGEPLYMALPLSKNP